MIDNMLFHALLEALPQTTRLVIIGDPGQLEPIGRGMPIHSLLDAGAFPRAHLSTNHRSGPGSTIPISGRRALDGLMPIFGDDLSHVPTTTTPETLRAVLETNRGKLRAKGPTEVLDAWRPVIFEANDALVDYLTPRRLWLIHQEATGWVSHSFTPPASEAEVSGWHPDAAILAEEVF